MTTAPLETASPDLDADLENPWVCVVWDDPVNLMTYVTFVFMQYFGYSKDKAEALMMDVHTKGQAAVSSGSRDEAVRDATAMHSYGLWATVQQG